MLSLRDTAAVAQTVLHPIDVARTRLQAKGVTMAFTARTFVKGISPQFVLAFPAGALQFAAYEWAKDQFEQMKMRLKALNDNQTAAAEQHQQSS